MTEPTPILTRAPKPVRLAAGRAIIAGADVATPLLLTMDELRIGLALLHPLSTIRPSEDWAPAAQSLCRKLAVALGAFHHPGAGPMSRGTPP